MFIATTKSPTTGRVSVYLKEGYRDQEGKVKHRNLKFYGFLDELEKEDPDILDKLRAEAKLKTKEEATLVKISLDLSKLTNKASRNIGYVFLESIYNDLNIPAFITAYGKNYNYSYDLNDILKLLVFSRALNPSSKKKTYENKGNYFFELKNFSLDDVYRSLDHLTSMKDKLMVHLNEEVVNQGLRDAALVFYDVTNYYFESNINDGFREKGVCKSNQKTVIVQMGLFIDSNGIPITYELFPGNTNDLITMRPILEKIKKEFNLGNITIVADKGNNSKCNLSLIDGYGDNYIVSQKIRNRGNLYSDIVLDEQGYVYNEDKTFKCKTVQLKKEVKNIDGTTSTITENLICYWSLKNQQYQQHKRGLLEEKIEQYLSKPSLINASNSFGIKKYFKKIKVDKETGEILKGKDEYLFDEEKYQRDCALDGYYAIVTNNLDFTPLDVIGHYRNLYKIEESFKITKSDLEGRPIYVWTKPHIEGHFLICYLALTIYRLLQLSLENKYQVNNLKESLSKVSIVSLEQNIFVMINQDKIFKELLSKNNIQLNDYIRLEEIRKAIKTIIN